MISPEHFETLTLDAGGVGPPGQVTMAIPSEFVEYVEIQPAEQPQFQCKFCNRQFFYSQTSLCEHEVKDHGYVRPSTVTTAKIAPSISIRDPEPVSTVGDQTDTVLENSFRICAENRTGVEPEYWAKWAKDNESSLKQFVLNIRTTHSFQFSDTGSPVLDLVPDYTAANFPKALLNLFGGGSAVVSENSIDSNDQTSGGQEKSEECTKIVIHPIHINQNFQTITVSEAPMLPEMGVDEPISEFSIIPIESEVEPVAEEQFTFSEYSNSFEFSNGHSTAGCDVPLGVYGGESILDMNSVVLASDNMFSEDDFQPEIPHASSMEDQMGDAIPPSQYLSAQEFGGDSAEVDSSVIANFDSMVVEQSQEQMNDFGHDQVLDSTDNLENPADEELPTETEEQQIHAYSNTLPFPDSADTVVEEETEPICSSESAVVEGNIGEELVASHVENYIIGEEEEEIVGKEEIAADEEEIVGEEEKMAETVDIPEADDISTTVEGSCEEMETIVDKAKTADEVTDGVRNEVRTPSGKEEPKIRKRTIAKEENDEKRSKRTKERNVTRTSDTPNRVTRSSASNSKPQKKRTNTTKMLLVNVRKISRTHSKELSSSLSESTNRKLTIGAKNNSLRSTSMALVKPSTNENIRVTGKSRKCATPKNESLSTRRLNLRSSDRTLRAKTKTPIRIISNSSKMNQESRCLRKHTSR